MSAPNCTFAEMVPLFAELFEPDPIRVFALIGRLKNLLRLGAAAGGRTTKGKAASFTPADVRELLVTMELCHVGVSPQKAIALAEQHGDTLMSTMSDDLAMVWIGPREGTGIQIDIRALFAAFARHLPDLTPEAASDARPQASASSPTAHVVDAGVGGNGEGGR